MSATKICDVACHLQRRLSIKVSLTECLQVNAFAEWIYSPGRFLLEIRTKTQPFHTLQSSGPGSCDLLC